MTPDTEAQQGQLKQGYLYAVRLLAASKKSTSQVQKRLLDKGYHPDIASQIIDQLKDNRILNDELLVQDTILWAQEGKRLGRNRIRLELKKRGINAATVDEAVRQIPDDKERALAFELGEVRWEKLKTLELRKRKQRLYSYLASRGFSFDLCREVVSQCEEKKHENLKN